jgi:hypothetical protein
MLAASGSRPERIAVRDKLVVSLSAVDAAGTASGLWTTGFSGTD